MRAGIDYSRDLAPSPVIRTMLVAGGLVVGTLGLRRSSAGGMAAAVVGIALVYRGARGWNPTAKRISVNTATTIRRSRMDVYGLWRRIDELPRYMQHLSKVSEINAVRSTWSFDVPGMDRRLEWMAEIVVDEEGRRLAWSSVPGGDVVTNGEVRFEDVPAGTCIRVDLEYRPGMGEAGRLAAKAINPALERMIRSDIRRVKSFLESGEIPTVEGQPAAR